MSTTPRPSDQPRDAKGRYQPIPEEYTPPEDIDCPCGSGEATIQREITEPYTFAENEVAVHYHYRHEGCPIGGTIVAVGAREVRRLGPLFDPRRYLSKPDSVPSIPVRMMADSGGVCR